MRSHGAKEQGLGLRKDTKEEESWKTERLAKFFNLAWLFNSGVLKYLTGFFASEPLAEKPVLLT